MTYLIEGVWSGYTSSQRHVVHRKYTTDEAFAAQVKALHWILFTDGTTLDLTVSENNGAVRQREVDGYGSLIRDCVREGVNTVYALQKKEGRA